MKNQEICPSPSHNSGYTPLKTAHSRKTLAVNIRFTDMVLDTGKIYIDAVIVEKKKAITANSGVREARPLYSRWV